MVDDLAPLGPGVHADAIAFVGEALRLAEPPRDEKAAADDLRIVVAQLRDGGDVALGHDQDVHRRLRIDVLEGHHMRVLVLDLGGGLAGDDATAAAMTTDGYRTDGYNTAFIESLRRKGVAGWARVRSASYAFARTATTSSSASRGITSPAPRVPRRRPERAGDASLTALRRVRPLTCGAATDTAPPAARAASARRRRRANRPPSQAPGCRDSGRRPRDPRPPTRRQRRRARADSARSARPRPRRPHDGAGSAENRPRASRRSHR